jgi:pectin methylesterase-like acyl-CoA thioesterase
MRSMRRAAPVTIAVAAGRYTDMLYLRSKDNVTLRGASRDGTVIAVRNSNGLNPGAGGGQAADAPGVGGGRSVLLVEDADLLHIDRLGIVNTTWRGKPQGGQAEAINFASEGRLIATDADFVSEQDTVLVSGWAWFYRSLIAGNVDFIWGYNHAALFEEDEIRSVGDSAGASKGGYIVQARTRSRDEPGFVFLNSRLTHGPGPAGNDVPPGSTALARPGTWDNVSYIACRMDDHIAAAGWSGEPHGGAGWYEYRSMDMAGKPLDLSRRRGGTVLTADQAARLSSRTRVFAGFDNGKGWNPAPTNLQR